MSEYSYFYRAAWGGELPSERLDELAFDHDLKSAKAFAQAKSVETGWCEVVTVFDGPLVESPLPVGAILFEHREQVHADGLTG